MLSTKLSYLHSDKSSLQFLKLNMSKYTNLMEKKEGNPIGSLNKLRPSSSASVLRENDCTDNSRKLIGSPSQSNTVNFHSLACYSLHKPNSSKNNLNDPRRSKSIFKGFSSETPKACLKELNSIPIYLQSLFKKITMANTTRNDCNSTHPVFNLKTNIDCSK